MTTLTRRVMSATFSLGTGSFGADGSDTVTVKGLRMSANIQKHGGQQLASLDLRIWGMPLEAIQQLTVLNILALEQVRMNSVTLFAGDEDGALTAVFQGTITEAWADASGAPEMCFVVSAQAGAFDRVRPIPPTSFNGPVDIATVLAGIGAQMDPALSVENNGVQGTFDDPYLAGTAVNQIFQVCSWAGCGSTIDYDKLVIAIWPFGGSRGGTALNVSAETGLVGYPQFTQSGIKFRLLYTQSVVFGQQIQMTSTLAAASGLWVVLAIAHSLDAEVFGGAWFTDIECGLYGHEAPIIGTVK